MIALLYAIFLKMSLDLPLPHEKVIMASRKVGNMSVELIIIIVLVAFSIVKIVSISKITKLMTDNIKKEAEKSKQDGTNER